MYEKRIIYYKDELNDEFSAAQINTKKIDEKYNYEGGVFRNIARIFFYYILAKPMAYIYLKIKYHHKIVNKECLKKAKETGCFLYGNHTNQIADALIPSMICHPKGAYVIVHADNVSMPFLGKITPSLGAIPLPDDRKALKNFLGKIKSLISEKKCITIYPEAHIWPYYTKIRNFEDSSFRYPVECGVPVFCFVNTYQKRKNSKKSKIVTYIDGPFYSDTKLSKKEQKIQLHESVLNSMKEMSKKSNLELIQYIKEQNL